MGTYYNLPRGQFFDEEQRYVNPATVAEKLRQAEATGDALLVAYTELEKELAALKARRCETCKSWDRELTVVAAVRFAFCENRMAYKEFKTRVVSEGWLCPLWAARAEEGGGE